MGLEHDIDTELRAAWVRADGRAGRKFLGPNLRALRAALGLSQTQLTRIIDPSGKLRHSTVAKWERGEHGPHVRSIPRILEVAVALVRRASATHSTDEEIRAALTEGPWTP